MIEIGVVECWSTVKVDLEVGWNFEKTQGFAKESYGGLLAAEGLPTAGSDELV